MITDVFSVCKDNIVFQMNEFRYSLLLICLFFETELVALDILQLTT